MSDQIYLLFEPLRTAGVATLITLDLHGWVGFERRPLTFWRVFGGTPTIAGVALEALF